MPWMASRPPAPMHSSVIQPSAPAKDNRTFSRFAMRITRFVPQQIFLQCDKFLYCSATISGSTASVTRRGAAFSQSKCASGIGDPRIGMQAHSVERPRPIMTSCGVRPRLMMPSEMFSSPKSPNASDGRKHAADRHGTLSSSVNVLLRFYELAFVPG